MDGQTDGQTDGHFDLEKASAQGADALKMLDRQTEPQTDITTVID